ncbi:Ig-like domain (group 3) [Gracilibacillus orientalis]|uniref:Ig-like domain (Group 3) n=1 Tax=Gracilibacillus orientalis TaxID=334253 RepID=A0A1I4P4D4_9BACI|nr:Ig-like domain (group 3) [Gracilibacillus orientalis]
MYAIITFIIFSAVIFTSNAIASDELDMRIQYEGETWDLSNEPTNDPDWYTSQDQMKFKVNLSDYYQDLEKEDEDGSTIQYGQPFEADVSRASVSVAQVTNADGQFNGVYEVTVDPHGNHEGQIEINLNIEEDNNWEIPSEQSPISFTIVKDTESPEINYSGIEDQKVYYSEQELQMDIDEENIDTKRVSVTHNGNEMDPAVEWNDNRGTVSFSESGNYQVEITAADKVDHQVKEELTFYLNTDDPVLEVETNSGDVVENGTVLTNENFTFTVENGIAVKSARVTISEDNSVIDQINMTTNGKSASGDYEFEEEGTYEVEVELEDAHGGERHELETFTLTVDQSNPEITITDNDDQPVTDEEVYKNTFDLDFLVEDPNLNLDQSSITVKHKYANSDTKKEVALSYKDGFATAEYDVDAEGEYEISGTLVDDAGNENTIDLSFALYTDSDLIDISDETNNGNLKEYYQDDVLVNVKYWDFNPIEKSFTVTKRNLITGENEPYLDSSDLSSVVFMSWIEHFFSEGEYYLSIETQNVTGDTETEKRKFIVDKTDPKVKLGSPISNNQHITSAFLEEQEGSLFNLSVSDDYLEDYQAQLEFTDTDGEKQTWVDDDAGSWVNREGTYHFNLNEELIGAEGDYTILLRAEDEVGRSAEKSLYFTIDNTAPDIELSDVDRFNDKELVNTVTVKEHNYEKNNVTINIEKRNKSGEFKTYESEDFDEWENNGYLSEADFPFHEDKKDESKSIDGTYRITVDAVDAAGNKATRKRAVFTIDTSDPKSAISGVEHQEHYIKGKTAQVDIKDNNINESASSLTVNKWDHNSEKFEKHDIDTNLEFERRQAEWQHDFEEEGTYEIIVKAIDKAGREAEEAHAIFTIDNTDPVVSIDNMKDQTYYDSELTAIFGVDELNYQDNNVTFEVTKDGAEYTEQVEGDTDEGWRNTAKQSELTYTFEEDGDYQVTLRAKDKAGNTSKEINKTFTIDTNSPSISVVGVEDGEYYDGNKDVDVGISDTNFADYQMTITKDDEEYEMEDIEEEDTTISFEHEFAEDGDYVINLSATDRAGNQSTEKVSFTVDKTDPAISIDGEIPEFISSDDIQENFIPITLTETNSKSKEVKISRVDNDGKKKTYPEEETGEWTTNGDIHRYDLNESFFEKDGDYEIVVVAEDKSNNTDKASFSFTVDNIAPVIDLSDLNEFNDAAKTETVKVTEHNYNTNEVDIKIYRENAQEKFVAYDDDFNSWKNRKEVTSLDFPFTKDGKYKVEVRATDAAGNTADQQTDVFTIDTVTPDLSITGVKQDTHYRTSKEVRASVEDANVSKADTVLGVYRLNSSTGRMEPFNRNKKPTFTRRSMDWRYNFSTSNEGTYRVQLNTTDLAGNKGAEQSVDFTIDNTAPVLAINHITDGTYYDAGRSAEMTIQETNHSQNKVQFEVSRNGQEITNTVEGQRGPSWRTASELSKLNYNFTQDGAYSIELNATDEAGNRSESSQKNFVIDTVQPDIEISGVEDGEYYNEDVPFAVSIADVNLDENTIRVTRNGQNYPVGGFAVTDNTYQNSIASLSHNFSQEGDYEVVVESIDKANNQQSQSVSFTIDKTDPVLTPVMGGEDQELVDGSYINHVFQPQFLLDNDEDTIVSVQLNGGSNIAGNIPLASSEMEYNYEVLARDKAGNETTLTISFTLDTSKPELSITGIIGNFTNENVRPQVTYSDKHLDEERTSVTLNGEPFRNGVELDREQDYKLEAVITDLADNVTEQSIVFTIDKTGPKITFNEVLSGKYFSEVLIPDILVEDMTGYDIIALTLNGEPYELGDPIETEGKNVLYFEVMDQAGNVEQLTVEFMIDLTPPAVIFDGVEENSENVEAVDLSIQLDDPEDTIQSVSVNGEDHGGEVTEEDGTKVINLSFSEIGEYNVEVSAYDKAGNEVTENLQFVIAEKSLLGKFSENKPLFSGSIAGLLALIIGIIAVLARKRARATAE